MQLNVGARRAMVSFLGLDWGTLAAIIIAIAAVLGLLTQFFKKEKPWRKVQVEHNLRLTSVEIKIDNLTESIDDLKQAIDEHEQRDQKDFERVESKIEKLTDLMIDMIGQKSVSPKSKK